MKKLKSQKRNIVENSNDLYLNVPAMFNEYDVNFYLIVGARGIGKTYGIIKYCMDNDLRLLYIRRLQTQIDNVFTKISSPAKPVCNDMEMLSNVEKLSKNLYGVYRAKTNDENKIESDFTYPPIMQATSLSTFATIRGVDFSDIDIIFFDEFIPEQREKPIKGEFEAFLNMLESIMRNKEIKEKGKSPKVVMAANSNNIYNPYFISLSLVRVTEKMIKDNTTKWIDYDRSIYLYMPKNVPISKEKETTALYKFAKDTTYSDMALKNIFRNDDSRVKIFPLREFIGKCSIGEINIYLHKSKNICYVCATPCGTKEHYDIMRADEVLQFQHRHSKFLTQLLLWGEGIYFDSLASEGLLKEYLTMEV